MRRPLAFVLVLAASRVLAQGPGGMSSAVGRSGQFTAYAVQAPSESAPLVTSVPAPLPGNRVFVLQPNLGFTPANNGTVKLTPPMFVMSCESLKQALLRSLALPDRWRGHVKCYLTASLAETEEPQLTAIHNATGWSYQLVVPRAVKSQTLVRSLVHVLLLEMANRNAGADPAHVPLWLVEGMAASLQAGNFSTFFSQPQTAVIGNNLPLRGLAEARALLGRQMPVSFQQLSWPEDQPDTEADRARARASAQLFVTELLDFQDGRACLAGMLDQLAQCLNWQTAFLRGFSPHFDSLLDVEKWWSVTCLSFTGRDSVQRWPDDLSFRQLQDAIDVPAQVYLSSNSLPTAAFITLQEAIRTWKPDDEAAAVVRALRGLAVVHGQL